MTANTIGRAAAVAALTAALTGMLSAQTREKGPWWPSPHGPKDQAGNSNYITPEKILKALRIPKTGQTYELGHIYERSMPQYGYRPYFLSVSRRPPPQKEGAGVGAPRLLHRLHRPDGHAVRRVRSPGAGRCGWRTGR